jgi:hypothetical protein
MLQDFGGRVVGLQKVGGVNIWPLDPVAGIGGMIGVDVDAEGRLSERIVDLTEGEEAGSSPVAVIAPPPAIKGADGESAGRKRAFVEIEDSEDEAGDEYGWGEEDDVAIAGVESATAPVPEGEVDAETMHQEERTEGTAAAALGADATHGKIKSRHQIIDNHEEPS